MKERPSTEKIYRELCAVIPGGVNSPVRACKAMEQLPLVAASAKGDLVVDVDGHSYIDYCGSWGALIHGHAHPDIFQAAQQRMALSSSFGMTTAIEGELAREVIKLMPSIERLRCVSSGTEATMSAIRLARGYTKRDLIIKFSGNYHGHADFLLVKAGSGAMELPQASSAGIPADFVKHTLCLDYNDTEGCRTVLRNPRVRSQLAAVIIEPIAGNMGVVPAKPEFLQMLRQETAQAGALLIFDEVITGFRVGTGGAQALYGITPDLTCLGKIMGGGFPAAAFGGHAAIMECLAPSGAVYQAGTLSGNPVAMAAGLCALQLLQRPEFYTELERKTHLLTQPIQQVMRARNFNGCIQQVGSMFTLFFGRKEVNRVEDTQKLDNALYARFFRYLFTQGVYIPPYQQEAWFISTAHTTAHLEKTRDLIVQFIENQK